MDTASISETIITRYSGLGNDTLDGGEGGDVLLLCSDGLTEEVTDLQIQDYLQSSSFCEERAAQLITGAKKAGGSDNITVVLVALLG